MIVSTFPTQDEAVKVSKVLLQERLIACANIVPAIQSLYWWQDSIQEEQEVLLLVKTQKELEQEVIDRIQTLHSYDVPAIYAIESTTTISDPYLDWIVNVTKQIK